MLRAGPFDDKPGAEVVKAVVVERVRGGNEGAGDTELKSGSCPPSFDGGEEWSNACGAVGSGGKL